MIARKCFEMRHINMRLKRKCQIGIGVTRVRDKLQHRHRLRDVDEQDSFAFERNFCYVQLLLLLQMMNEVHTYV